MRDPVTAFVALGANLGDARVAVLQAFESLASWPNVQVTGRSSLYRTAPHEAQGPDFVNAVARIETRLSAPEGWTLCRPSNTVQAVCAPT